MSCSRHFCIHFKTALSQVRQAALFIKQVLPAETQKEYGRFVRTPFHTPCMARYSVLHLLDVLSGGDKPSPVGEGGSRRLTDEELVWRFLTPHPPLSRSPFPHWGRLILCAPKVHLLFLTSTAFVDTKAKPRAKRGEGYISWFNLFSILINQSLFRYSLKHSQANSSFKRRTTCLLSNGASYTCHPITSG